MKKLIFILCGLIGVNAVASDITNGPLQQHPALCNYGYNPNCGQNNEAPPKKIIRYITVNVPSKYGALALNKKTGVSGGALNMNSKAEAKREAIKKCENGGKNAPCKVISWVRNGCIAAATNSKNILFTAAEEPGDAEDVVMNKCRAAGASGCRLTIPEACSMPDTSQY